MEKAWFYEKLFFQVAFIIKKDQKKYSVKDTMSIKISFMHYMKGTKVMLPVVCIQVFLLLFLLHYRFHLVKG